MAKAPFNSETEAPRLTIRREEARALILSRIEQANSILEPPPASERSLQEAKLVYDRWNSYNEELLNRSFSSKEYAVIYRSTGRNMVVPMNPSFSWQVESLRSRLSTKLNALHSLAERLDLIPEPIDASNVNQPKLENGSGNRTIRNRVFVVHGRDEEAKAIVARFLENCNLIPIILHEQADRGRTIIEKFEQEADVHFAVVLLTPDDRGGIKYASDEQTHASLKDRARQNVVFELGYFLGRLGRGNVCALLRGPVELPSDINGVIYTSMAADDGWKLKLAKELRSAGFDMDLNSVFG